MHAHAHSHDHGHAHHHHAPIGGRYSIAIALNIAFVAIETLAGFWANSTALLADAGHNVSDVLGLAMAGAGAWLSGRAPTSRRTYGFGKAGVLAALGNVLLLVGACGAIGWEAARRLAQPEPILPGVVTIVAGAGVLVNGATALLFFRRRMNDVNARGAFLHMAADAGVSAAVILAGLAIYWTGALWIDPAMSLAVCAVILWGAWGLTRESLDLALDAAPSGIDVDAVRRHLEALPGVTAVHDLHVWAMSATEPALTAHLVLPGGGDDAFLANAAAGLGKTFAIHHATLQVERAHADACAEHAHP
ncbi:MAG TPA: cation diffusion facilitator family transporter [Caulobacterales bacterium]|nr:cation diffusion facilitator family transporter [Caulobacterales bacterium]